jgi:fructokinase
MNLIGIGEILWDVFSDSRHLGGATFNCVHHIKQLGHQGLVISRIGSDEPGDELLKLLNSKGFDTGYIQIDPHRETGYVSVVLDENAKPTFTCSETAPYDYLEWDERFPQLAAEVDAVVFGTFAQRTEQAARITSDFLDLCKNAIKIFDVNFREWNNNTKNAVRNCLTTADILKINDSELVKMRELYPELSKNCAESLLQLVEIGNLRVACLTAGEWGCLLTDGTDIVYCPGIDKKPVDTTGAGDAFISALILHYYQDKTLHEAGRYANVVAANTMLQTGATPEYSPKTINNFAAEEHRYHIYDEWRSYLINGLDTV